MKFRFRKDLPIEMLPDGTVAANIIWYDDDTDPDTGNAKFIDKIRLPYWFVYQTDEEREAYLLATIKARHDEIQKTEQLRRAVPMPRSVRELAQAVHEITPSGSVLVRRQVVQETAVRPDPKKIKKAETEGDARD